jgi:long-subunit fatty acid transport protein
VGYAHLFAREVSIHDDQRATGGGLIDGTYKASIDLLSVQLAYRFD